VNHVKGLKFSHRQQRQTLCPYHQLLSLQSLGWSGITISWVLDLFARAMPGDIDPTALSRPISTTPILPPKTISTTVVTAVKPSKPSGHVPPRIDLEPLYTALKTAIGDHWGTYKDSINLFVMG
jgi:hypothetical protein